MTKEQFKSVVSLLNRLRAKEQITDEEYVDILYPTLEQHRSIEYVPWWPHVYYTDDTTTPRVTYESTSTSNPT